MKKKKKKIVYTDKPSYEQLFVITFSFWSLSLAYVYSLQYGSNLNPQPRGILQKEYFSN